MVFDTFGSDVGYRFLPFCPKNTYLEKIRLHLKLDMKNPACGLHQVSHKKCVQRHLYVLDKNKVLTFSMDFSKFAKRSAVLTGLQHHCTGLHVMRKHLQIELASHRHCKSGKT